MLASANTGRAETGKTWRDLMANIVERYHNSLRVALPGLEGLADEVARGRRVPIGVMDRLSREFSVLADSLRAHLLQQEGHLFPMIRHVCESVEQAGWACHLDETLEELMNEAARADRESVASVQRAASYLSGLDGIESEPLVGKLAKGVRELHEDLEAHVQLETNVLFPVVRELLRGDHQGMERLLAASNPRPSFDAPGDASVSYCCLDQAMPEMRDRDQPCAGQEMKTVLHALRDRLSVNKAIVLGTWLPRQLRGLYYENWQHRWDRATNAQKEDFLCEIAHSLKNELDREPKETARLVFRALAEQIPAHDVESVRNCLPEEIRSLWPAADAATATAELITADQETG
jgi:uncharacterized protein (DUF2267 family)/iron-sulfur cluster repair protein YtfE (RIC family)